MTTAAGSGSLREPRGLVESGAAQAIVRLGQWTKIGSTAGPLRIVARNLKREAPYKWRSRAFDMPVLPRNNL
jgi:hypothetical protein